MHRQRSRTIPAILLFLALPGPAALAADPPATAPKTIVRSFEHVVMKGEALPANLGQPIPLMRLYALREGKMQPVPYQVDEITEDGTWVLPSQSPYLSRKQAGKMVMAVDEPPDILDDNDELAFMMADTGDRAPPSAWPPGVLRSDEITLTDPLTGGQGWGYLFSFPTPVEPSSVDYVEYRFRQDTTADLIHSDLFTLHFSHEVPITWDAITFDDGVNIIDRMKIRLHCRLFHLFTIDKNETHLNSQLWQFKDGPVRVIRRVRSSVKLVAKLKSPSVNSETLYYRNAVLLPFRVKIPFTPKGIVSDLYFEGGPDFRDLYGWKLRLNTDDRWLQVDGHTDEVEATIRADGAKWFILKGPGKAMLYDLTLVNEKEVGLRRRFHYLDDAVQANPPEFHPGQVPYIGYFVDGIGDVKGGSVFRFHVLAFFLDRDYSEAELVDTMKIYENPIRAEVKPPAEGG